MCIGRSTQDPRPSSALDNGRTSRPVRLMLHIPKVLCKYPDTGRISIVNAALVKTLSARIYQNTRYFHDSRKKCMHVLRCDASFYPIGWPPVTPSLRMAILYLAMCISFNLASVAGSCSNGYRRWRRGSRKTKKF